MNSYYNFVSESYDLMESVSADPFMRAAKGIKMARGKMLNGSKFAGEAYHTMGDIAPEFGKLFNSAARSVEAEIPGAKKVWDLIKVRAAEMKSNIETATRRFTKDARTSVRSHERNLAKYAHAAGL